MSAFVLRAKKTIQKYAMIQPGDRVLVGVSGGADSMALLHVLRELRGDFRLSLVAAHLDHGLRPEGRAEKNFVRGAAAELGIPFVGGKADVRAKQKEGRLNLQEAAREARYSFLLQAAKKHRAAKIALGHTADDQAESVLMRFLRGAGTRGLGGIPPVRDGIFIRPLIESRREEIESFLANREIAFVNDPSNRSLRYFRNRIRHELLPALLQYNPRLPQILVSMAEIFRAEEEFWKTLLEEKFPSLIRSRKKDLITLDIPSLLNLPLPLRLRSLRYAAEKILGNLRRVGLVHILAVDRLLQSPQPNQNLRLPQGLAVSKAYQALTLARSREEILPFEISVSGPGCWAVPEIGREMIFEVLTRSRIRLKNPSNVALLDGDKISFPLTIRSFRPGDRLQPLGMEGGKKVKDLFIDCKIPAGERKKIPLLFKDKQLLWVAGLRLDHRVRLQPETQRVLRVELV